MAKLKVTKTKVVTPTAAPQNKKLSFTPKVVKKPPTSPARKTTGQTSSASLKSKSQSPVNSNFENMQNVPAAAKQKASSLWHRLSAWWQAFLGNDVREPDKRLYIRLSILLILFGCGIICWKIYDDNFGYLGALSTKLKVMKTAGWSSLNLMKKPMSPESLTQYFAAMREAGSLTNLELHGVQVAAAARKAHDAFFTFKVFHFDKAESAAHLATWAFLMGVATVMLYIAPIFLTLYTLWLLLKYFKYWTKAALGYLLEVNFKFIVDWIVAEVKKVFAEIVNMIVKVLTFGIKKGKTVTVSMPKYSDYVKKWYKKYITPVLREIDNEYGCRVDTRKRKIAKALGWILLPVKQIYSWYAMLKRYGLDLPLSEFRDSVMRTYPAFVKVNAQYADNLTELDRKYYEYLRLLQRRGNLSKKQEKLITKAPTKPTPIMKNLALKTLDFRIKNDQISEANEVCDIIK